MNLILQTTCPDPGAWWSGADECQAELAATGTGDPRMVLVIVALAMLAGIIAVVLTAARRRRDRSA